MNFRRLFSKSTICIIGVVVILFLVLLKITEFHWQYIRMATQIFEERGVSQTVTHNFTRLQNCTKMKNIAFLKVHKCGSTTISNALRRFAIRNHLNTVLMNTPNNYWIFSGFTALVPLPKGEFFNILDIDSFYNRTMYQKLIPNNPFFLGILREPVERYISFEFDPSFHGGIFRRNVSNIFMFEDPMGGDPRSLSQQMSVEFGLKSNQRYNEVAILNHLQTIDEEFDFVIIHEYFDESLVLLKRLLCWQMKDIMYMISNKSRSKKTYAITPSGRRKLQEQLKADIMFYEHFKTKLSNLMVSLGLEFLQEVSHYKSTLRLVKDYCLYGKEQTSKIEIPISSWNKPFSVDKEECELMMMVEGPMVKMMIENALKKYTISLKS